MKLAENDLIKIKVALKNNIIYNNKKSNNIFLPLISDLYMLYTCIVYDDASKIFHILYGKSKTHFPHQAEALRRKKGKFRKQRKFSRNIYIIHYPVDVPWIYIRLNKNICNSN